MKVQINDCPCCGAEHEQVIFSMANVRLGAVTHKFVCPTTGESMFWGLAIGLVPEKLVALAAPAVT